MALCRAAVVIALLGGAAGCGDDEAPDPRSQLRTPPPYVGAPDPLPSPTPTATARDPRPTQADAERLRPLIAAWAEALRRSDPEAAARFFRLPAIVQQSGAPLELTTPDQVLAFNAALPCGARLLEVQHIGRYVVGTFRLTERPGSKCDAPGALVRVAFVVRGRRFSEWYQVPDARGAKPGPPARPAIPDSSRRSS